MAKENEIDYIKQVARTDGVSQEEFSRYLSNKPFSDMRCGEYLMDVAQIMKLLPPPPARLLDVGVGSGWTSELFAMRGYDVVGLDISPDMITLANKRLGKAKFLVCDYETGPIPTGFDIAVIYDALHHAENEFLVLRNIYDALSEQGMLITIEPGVGHSTTPDSLEVMRKYGTTEKDMPFLHQKKLMQEAGFGVVEQFLRVSQLPLENVGAMKGAFKQVRHGLALNYGSATGLTSVVVARKMSGVGDSNNSQDVAERLLKLSILQDKFIQDSNHHTD